MSSFKELNSRLHKLKQKLNSKNYDKGVLTKEIEDIEKKIISIEKQIQDYNNQGIVVTEHAVLRYIERVLGIDTIEIRKKILDEKSKEDILTLGNCLYPRDGYKIRVQNKRVLTVITKDNDRD
jgi:hypothetical protein